MDEIMEDLGMSVLFLVISGLVLKLFLMCMNMVV